MRNRPSPVIVLALIFSTLTSLCQADVSLHLAYQRERPDSIPASFSNDRSFGYVSRKPYILSSELLDAKVVNSTDGYVVEITLAPTAVEKFNSLATENLRAQKHRDFAAYVGLGVLVDGRPSEVIQGVFQPLDKNTLWWSVAAEGRTPEALHEATARVAAIKSRSPSVRRESP